MKSTTKEAGVAAPGKPFLMRVGIGLFGLGMIAVLAVFIMFAAGVITPLGLLLGLIALVIEARAKK